MNGCHRPKSETNDSLNANKMNNFPSFEVSSTSKSSKSGSESIQSKQILSMFNNLQCQLMTLQSTMVSLQMNQNAIQNTVEEVAKKVTKISSKVNSIQANIRFEDKEAGDVATESLMETEETDVDCQRKEKKKRKKESTLIEEAIDKTVGEKSAISSAKKSRNDKKSTKSDLNGQCIDYNSHNVSEQIELSNVSKIEKERKKSKSELVSVEKNEEIETSTPGWSVQYEQNRKKRKRSRKKKPQPRPEIPAEVPPPPPPPQVIHMNLPRNQRPSNVKVKFESDSEEEGNTAAVNSASGDTSGKITPCTQAVTKPDTSTPKSFLSSTKPNTSTPKSCPSSKKPETITPKSCPTSKKPETITPKSTKWTPPPGASNKNKRWMLRSLQVGNVLKHLRGEGDGNGGSPGEKETEESTEVAINGDKSSPVSISSPVHQNILRKNSKPVLSLKKSLEKNGEVETFEAIPVSISEFSSFQDLHGPPRVGDRIAYKVIELSDTYSPEISAYKVADVISYDNQTGQVQLCLTEPTKVKQYPGKFDIPEIMETEESELQSENLNIEISYQELLEPKLIK